MRVPGSTYNTMGALVLSSAALILLPLSASADWSMGGGSFGDPGVGIVSPAAKVRSLKEVGLSGESPFREPPEVAETFADNTAIYKTENEDQRSALSTILKLKRGYETFDISLIKEILGNEFERRLLISGDKAIVEGREQFIAARSTWKKIGKPSRELRYLITDIATGETGTSVTIVALSIYKSRYFNPRFLETLRFEFNNGRWYLTRQTMRSLSPSNSKRYSAQIYVVSWDVSLSAAFSKLSVSAGADFVIDRMRENTESDNVPAGSGIMTQILVVFREPPPVGAQIAVEHQWPQDRTSFPLYRFEHEVKDVKPFFVLENVVAPSCCSGDSVSFTIKVNGEEVASKIVGVF